MEREERQPKPIQELLDVVYEHDDVTHWIGKLDHADSSKESRKPTHSDRSDNKED